MDYPNLFIYDLDAAFLNPTHMFNYGTCVKECPSTSESGIECADYTVNPRDPRVNNCLDFGPRETLGPADKSVYPTWYVMNYCSPDFDKLSEADQAMYDVFMEGLQNSMV